MEDVTDSTTISKYLHVEVMGEKWHELIYDTSQAGNYRCACGLNRFACRVSNPDYLNNKSDWVDFTNFSL